MSGARLQRMRFPIQRILDWLVERIVTILAITAAGVTLDADPGTDRERAHRGPRPCGGRTFGRSGQWQGYRGRMDDEQVRDPSCPTCGQPLRHGGHLSPEGAALVTASGNPGVTFETQGRCENEACLDFGREFAPAEWLQ